MKPGQRRWVFLIAVAGLLAFYLWGLDGLPGFGHYPGPYGDAINAVAVAQTHATGVVSAINFDYRGFDTLGEEFILFIAVVGVLSTLRELRNEDEDPVRDEAADREGRSNPATSDAVRIAALAFVGPVLVIGWYLTSHAQTSPSGGFQGGVVLATAFILVYLGGQFVALKRITPGVVVDAIEAIGAGGFAVIGASALVGGAAYLTNIIPLGTTPGAVNSSGTIALISFCVGLEVTAAFVLILGEFIEQTLAIRQKAR